MVQWNRWAAAFPALLISSSLMLAGCSKEEEAANALALLEAAYEESEETAAEKRVSFKARYEALAKDYWGTEAGLDASIWLMRTAARAEGRANREAVVAEYTDAILAEYAGSPNLDKLALEAGSLFSVDQMDRYFGRLREESPHPGVRAASIYYPAQRKMLRSRVRRSEENGDDGEGLRADLQLLVDEYGDLPLGTSTYGVMADAHLNAHSEEELAIGQPAPEIVGVNVDGEEMRLSQFLGKVVVIDFWGDW